MNTIRFTCTAWRRIRNYRPTLVLKCEIDEDAYARSPFFQRLPRTPNNSLYEYELCFHHGWPTTPPKSGRRVKFEQALDEMSGKVDTIRIHFANGEFLTISSQTLRRPERPYQIGDGDPRDVRNTGR